MTKDTPHIPAPHEPDAVPALPVLIAGAVIVVFAGVTHLAVWLALPSWRIDSFDPPDTPARHDWGNAGREQLDTLRAREHENLTTYAWLDSDRTRARIPVEHAMRLLLEERRTDDPTETAP